MPTWASTPIKYCARATAKMPSAERHRQWLVQNPRYGQKTAEEFAELTKRFGKKLLDHQILVHDTFGASAWFDIEGSNGLHTAAVKTIETSRCMSEEKAYPLVLMVGVRADAIRRGALYISPKAGVYDVISLASLRNRKTIPVRRSGSGEVLCPDIRSCIGLGARRAFGGAG